MRSRSRAFEASSRGRLIEKGLIYSPAYGLTEFAVPRFEDFVRRRFPLEDQA